MMTKHTLFFISYPAITHPLVNEKPELKLKYICLIEHYRKKLCPDDTEVLIRFDRFKADFLANISENNYDTKSAIKEITKTRFTPFRFFSYRYVFLFDCIYLLSIDGFNYATQICDMLKESVHQRYHKKMDFILDKMLSNPSELQGIQMITDEMIKSLIDAQSFIRTTEKKVVFTATMSAGKSTLINALIGQELSFTKKAACTATVMDFYSSPVYHPKYNVFDEQGEKLNLSAPQVRKTSEERKTPLSIAGYFNSEVGKYKIRLIDTPGVNSFLNPAHKQITRDELINNEHDVIVYVIPVENYGSEGDFAHLSFIHKNVKYRKIIFAVNMMDSCDFEDDDIEEIISNISSHLTDIGYTDPIVCPMSAKAGLLFKQALSHSKLSPNEITELKTFVRKYEDEAYDLSPYFSIETTTDFCDEGFPLDNLDYHELQELYVRTGLPQFEAMIINAIKEE